MKSVTKLMLLNERDEKFFGEGPCCLLRRVEETGSLRAAAISMGMAYTKALKILKTAEETLGFPLTERSIGGKRGGGSTLTLEGAAWLSKYEAYRDSCVKENKKLFHDYFPQLGCVIMASGLGKRFGGNKLMADFCGQPMISGILDASEGLFARRVVVTRSREVEELCRQRRIMVIFHDLPSRSDVVRLGMEAMAEMDGCMFCLGDQPLLRRETIAELIRCWESDRNSIWRTAFQSEHGSPVLFPQWAFPELSDLPDGKGGGWVIQTHPQQLRTISVSNQHELMDIDTQEDLNILQLLKQNSFNTATGE